MASSILLPGATNALWTSKSSENPDNCSRVFTMMVVLAWAFMLKKWIPLYKLNGLIFSHMKSKSELLVMVITGQGSSFSVFCFNFQ